MGNGDGLLRCVPARWLSLPAVEEALKCWPAAVKAYFKMWDQKNILI